MKKIILVIISLLMIINTTAQTRNGLGVHVGYNSTGLYDVNNGYYDELETLNGFQIGLRYNLKIGPIGICPELNYVNVNYNYPATYYYDSFFDEWGTIANEGTQSLNYISLPILLKFYVAGFNVHIGAQASYLLGGTITPEGMDGNSITDDTYYLDVNGENSWTYNDIDFAGIIGIGLDTRIGLYISLRTIISTTPVDNVDVFNALFTTMDGEDGMAKLISSQLSVGYKF